MDKSQHQTTQIRVTRKTQADLIDLRALLVRQMELAGEQSAGYFWRCRATNADLLHWAVTDAALTLLAQNQKLQTAKAEKCSTCSTEMSRSSKSSAAQAEACAAARSIEQKPTSPRHRARKP
jgi:hypothetical protein